MDRDAEDTVIRPTRADATAHEVDDADTLLVTAVRLLAAGPGAGPAAGGGESSPGRPETPRAAARSPRTYRFRINNHEPIDLDRPAHVGRRPALPRVPQRVRPRLVRVPSPLQEVSATHLEVRQEGASVIITDLRSTNGTVVTVPGARPRSLRPGESLVVTPGTVVDIGDGNVLEILALSRVSDETSMNQGAPQ